MIKVIGINGSPRKYGNTAKLLELALGGARKEGAQTVRYDLYEMDIKPCMGCLSDEQLACKPPCVFEDDMTRIYDDILEADCLIISTPIYWFNVSGPLKNFIDRLTVFENMIYHVGYSLVEGKIAGVIAVGNEQGGAAVISNLLLTLNSMGFIIPPWCFTYFTKISDVLNDSNAVLDAVNVGRVVVKMAKITRNAGRWYKSSLPYLEELLYHVESKAEKYLEKEYTERRKKFESLYSSGESRQ